MDRLELVNFMNPRHLQLIILPTEQCNFRCTYCYEDFDIGQMKPNTVEAIKKLLTKRIPKLDALRLSWFGGEPLMAKKIVTELNAFAQSGSMAHGVQFLSTMTTNAYGLDRGTFDSLVGQDVREYQISIDGDEDEHDQTRKLVSGKGSFDRIWNNLLALRGNGEKFKITLRLHVHQKNVDSMHRLLPKLHAEFGNDPRFHIFLKAVGNWGGESVKQLALLNRSGDAIDGLKRSLDELGWFVPRQAKPGAAAPFMPCYAAQPNSFVIRADGRLAKCTVAFSDPRNHVGRINDDGTLTIEDNKVHTFMRGFKSLDESALHCPMKDMPKNEEVKVMKFERNIASAAIA
jgi:uncharacterized protein